MSDDLVNTKISLDYEQRRRASELESSVMDDYLAAAYEIIFLRDANAALLASLKEMGDWVSAGLQASDEAWPDARCLKHTEEIATRARVAIERAENRREIRS
jgi:hypothetical protein